MSENNNELMIYESACRAVAEAVSVDEVKDIRDKAVALRAYARQAKNRGMEMDAAEIRMRAERRLGGLIRRQKETVGLNRGGGTGANQHRAASTTETPAAVPTLADAGIDRKLSSHSQKLDAVPEKRFEEMVDARRERIARDVQIRGTLGTGENEWGTPLEYIEMASKVLGGIDLDPASTDAAQKGIKAGNYFTSDDDGLAHEWKGRVWLNPPYAQPDIALFVSKMVSEWKSGRIKAAIMLTHNYTDTKWFHEAAEAADGMCFTRGRIRFLDPQGMRASPTQGQVFFYFGPSIGAFKEFFGEIGLVMVRHDG